MPALTGLSPHLRLQSDERLVALTRRGHHGAFEALVKRYQPRLLAFCRHMLGSVEDAEDVLQEVLAAAYRAICADDRPITARPWLYRIARNRCLNHLRRPQDAGQDSMDDFERAQGTTTADTVHRREELREIVADVQGLPETQRTALVLREMDSLTYDQIAEAMETTVPSVKSLLVRARLSLAEASEARRLTCAEVRLELSQAAEGIARASAPARRHVRSCPRCRSFRRDLRSTSRALAAVYPVGPLVALKHFGLAKLGGGSAGAAVGEGAAGSSAAAGGLLGGGVAGFASAGAGSIVTKAAAGLVAAAVVGVGAVGVRGGDEQRAPAGGASQAQAGPRAEAPQDADRGRFAGGSWNGLARAANLRPAVAAQPRAQSPSQNPVAEPPPAARPAEPEPSAPYPATVAEGDPEPATSEHGDGEAPEHGTGQAGPEHAQPSDESQRDDAPLLGAGTLGGNRGDRETAPERQSSTGDSAERPPRDNEARRRSAPDSQKPGGSGARAD